MPNKVPPVPYQGPMTNKAMIGTPVWLDWFKQVLARIGGSTVVYNLDELWTFIENRIEKPGMIKPFAGAAAPTGYLACDGAAVSRSTYSDLFTAIGTAWGVGDGSTTFNVPDFRGKFPVGKDSGTFPTVGGTGGAESTALPNHTHSAGSLVTGGPSATIQVAAFTAPPGTVVATSGHTHSVSGSTGNPDSNPAIPTLPPYGVVLMVIKT